jgi:hypothetical protein
MKTTRTSAGLVALAAVASTLLSTAAQSAVVLVTDSRSVRSTGNVGSPTSFVSWTREERAPSGFGQFVYDIEENHNAGSNSAGGSVAMTSNVTSSLLSGTATSFAVVDINETNSFYSNGSDSNARFEVTFQVSAPTYFALTGELVNEVQGSSCCGGASLSLRNTNYSSPRFDVSFGTTSYNVGQTQNILLYGLLDPNTYTLMAVANAAADGYSIGSSEEARAMFDFQLKLDSNAIPAPAPSALWLLLTGMASVLTWVRRRASPS